ncbi:hypothetical protein M0805_004026 [Coniferiporia weirii]|nr:hypothetical protein M0805_004026 [Coniferiporia weirii]
MTIPFNDRLSFDRTLGTYIEFPTCSDAMLASLTLALGVNYAVMDAVLSIVKHSAFDPTEITLHGTEDICAHIANRRCQDAVALMSRKPDSGRSFVPQVIVEHVIEIIGDKLERETRSSTAASPFLHVRVSREAQELRKTLLNACLVQRSWVQLTRRALGRCLTLINPSRKSMLDSLRQPFLGPWTRELSVVISEDDRKPLLVKPFQTLVSKRLTAVSRMSMKAHHRDISALTHLFNLMPSIKELRLEAYRECEDYTPALPSLFSSITSLRHLEHLSLKLPEWIPSELSAHELPAELSRISTSPYLQSVHLYCDLPAERLSWTRNPGGDFSLKALEKTFCHKSGISHGHPASVLRPLAGLLRRLDDLRLFVPESGNTALPRIFEYCSDIRRLYFESDDFPSNEVLKCIPDMVERLAFQFSVDFTKYPTSDLEPWDALDIQLREYLVKGCCPKLQTLRVYMHSQTEGLLVCTKGRYRFRVLQDIKLRRVEVACAERGIDFVFLHQPDKLRGHWLD